ncbi:hypothetical protein SAMN05660649_02265 [Desulfotomaculum arcticum]|uniref:Damage-control phosphatase ARMT1-like metal-binding domain-containing protein n=2 Tax=Desulfotruncus TaxID=2867377 RepID=A0A1I2THL9_9FIRM|nr:hypothetical protein SAMN05660649_02265 [Desulfotomaculum arcticum] [Desulfotruncus arcticus DSM 17038]
MMIEKTGLSRFDLLLVSLQIALLLGIFLFKTAFVNLKNLEQCEPIPKAFIKKFLIENTRCVKLIKVILMRGLKMKASIDCVHCYLKQAVNCMSIAGIDEDKQYPVLFNIMDNVKTMDRQRTPAENSTEMLINLYQMINSNDPYKEIKQRLNTLGLDLYPKLKAYINKSDNKLYDALKIAASGNIIDLGISRDFDINASLEHSLSEGFSKDDYDRFIDKLNRVDHVVIVGDNAGEIVFDKLLVEELNKKGKKVIYIVKGGPILNDATMEDAIQVGMDTITEVITTGSNYLGVPLNKVAPKIVTLLADSGLVISKGQANFESLEHEELARDRVFFLLKIKCPWVGTTAGANFGDVVFFVR